MDAIGLWDLEFFCGQEIGFADVDLIILKSHISPIFQVISSPMNNINPNIYQ